MTLSAPTKPIFLIAVVLAVLSVLGYFVTIPFVTAYAYWLIVIAFIVLAAGTMMKGA